MKYLVRIIKRGFPGYASIIPPAARVPGRKIPINKPCTIATLLRLLSVMAGLIMTAEAHAYAIRVNLQKEIWITPGMVAGGSGSENDPFSVRSAADFDSLMTKAISSGARIINLTPGTFPTAGWIPSAGGSGWKLQSGMKLRGAGPELTILQRSGGNRKVNGIMIYAPGNHIEVSGLTIDCAAVGDDTGKIHALEFGGSFNVGRNLVAERPIGQINAVSREAFVFMTEAPAVGNLFEFCIVTNIVKATSAGATTYLNGFAGNGSTTFRDCRVYLPTGTNRTGIGFNLQSGRNQLLERCFVYGGGAAVYGDTASFKDITIRDCIFTEIRNGIKFDLENPACGNLDNLRVIRNTFEFSKDVRNVPSALVIYSDTNVHAFARNIRITENTFKTVGDAVQQSGEYIFAVSVFDKNRSMDNITAFNNSTDRRFMMFQGDFKQTPGNNTLYVLNRTSDGEMPITMNRAPTAGLKHQVIRSAFEEINADSEFVTIKAPSDSSFSLPSGSKKERALTIYNDQNRNGTAVVTITPSFGASIQPGNATKIAIPPNQFARFTFDGSSWSQR